MRTTYLCNTAIRLDQIIRSLGIAKESEIIENMEFDWIQYDILYNDFSVSIIDSDRIMDRCTIVVQAPNYYRAITPDSRIYRVLDIFIRELENIRIDCSTLHLVEKRVDYVITYRLIRDIIRNNDHIEVHALNGLLV